MSAYRTGTFFAGPTEIPPTFSVDKFWDRVKKTDHCWVWTGSSNNGYGRIEHRRRSFLAHRLSWLITQGSIEPTLQLDHLCRNRLCVNPAHLEPVTQKENTLRGISPVAENATKTRCCNGHPLTPENVYLHRGSRRCRPCQRANAAVYRAKLAVMRGEAS